MNNLDQAAQVIMLCVQKKYSPRRIAESLADFGLLAPDLPEPDRAVTSDDAEWYRPGQISIIARWADRIEVFGLTPNRQKFHLSLTGTEAEDAAHTLLAAAQYAGGQDD